MSDRDKYSSLSWMKAGQSWGMAHVVTTKGSDNYVTLCQVLLSGKYATKAEKYTTRCPECIKKLEEKENSRIGSIETCPHCGEPYQVEFSRQKSCYKPFCTAERRRLSSLKYRERKVQASYG